MIIETTLDHRYRQLEIPIWMHSQSASMRVDSLVSVVNLPFLLRFHLDNSCGIVILVRIWVSESFCIAHEWVLLRRRRYYENLTVVFRPWHFVLLRCIFWWGLRISFFWICFEKQQPLLYALVILILYHLVQRKNFNQAMVLRQLLKWSLTLEYPVCCTFS